MVPIFNIKPHSAGYTTSSDAMGKTFLSRDNYNAAILVALSYSYEYPGIIIHIYIYN
ncbi:hypothetical protein Hanom_Chr00s004520g01723111 [Helianthus anomalus]